MRTRFTWVILLLAVTLAPAHGALGTPALFWYSDPVKPGEIALLQGDQISDQCRVDFLRLGDGDAGAAQAPPAGPGGTGVSPVQIAPLQASITSVKFEIPPKLKEGIYATRLTSANGSTGWVYLNSPNIWWQQGDWGAEASPGGWLRVFGRCLSFGDKAKLVLRAPGKAPVSLKLTRQECWSLSADLPANLPAAEYEVWVHNGYSGAAGWRSAGTTRVAAHEPFWKTDRFDITAYGAIPDDERDDTVALRQALAAAAANGGGIVYVPRGRFTLTGGLSLPKHVLLQGAGENLALLEWQDMAQPPDALIAGLDNFSVQDLSLYAINHRVGISAADAAHGGGQGNLWLRHVRMRLNRSLNVPADVAAQRQTTAAGPALQVGGANLQITDCDIYGDGEGLFLDAGPNSVVARNQVYTPSGGWSYGGGAPNLIFEDNYFFGATVNEGGDHEYCARNRVQHEYRGYREMMVTDTGGGTYVGKVASCSGTQVVLADKIDWHNRHGFTILSGTGTGQWRRIEKVEGQILTLDRPLDVPPDENSVVAVTSLLCQVLWVDNDTQDGADAVCLYGVAYDCVVAGNTCARSTGYEVLGFNYNGPAPCLYVQVLNNEITQGSGMKGPGSGDGFTWLRVRSGDTAQVPGTTFGYKGPMVRGTVVRGNVLRSNGNIAIVGSPADTVIDHNTVREAQVGISVSGGATGVLLWRNQLEGLDRPVTPAVNQAFAHPADLALAGMNTAERYLPQAPPAGWPEIRRRLVALQSEDPAGTQTVMGVQACLSDAGKALSALPGPLPANLVRSLFSLETNSNPWAMAGYIDANKGGDQYLDLYLLSAAWAPPLEVTAQLAAPDTWRITAPPPLALKPGASAVRLRVGMNIPLRTWGVYRVPLTYTFKGAGWQLQATDSFTFGTGPIKDWAVVGPFRNETKSALDRAVHPPERSQDLSAEYDTPAGKLKWQTVTSPDGAMKLKDLLGDGTRQVAYAVGVIRAAREIPVSLSATNGASGLAVFVNRQLALETQRGGEKRGPVTLAAGDNVVFVIISSLGAEWSFSVRVDPLVPVGPGELTVVPAAELSDVPALQPAATPVPRGAGLPFAQGQDWRLVFADDFSWPRTGLDWDFVEGTWVPQPGVIRAVDGMATMAYHGRVLPPARVEYDLRPLQGNYRRVMGVGFTPAGEAGGRCLWGATKGAGYFLTFGWHDDKANQVWRQEKSVLVSHDPPFPVDNKWQHVIVQFIPPKMEMYVDGKLALEYTDPNWLPDLDTISFYDWPTPAEITNVRIYSAAAGEEK